MSVNGRRVFPAVAVVVTLGIGILIGTLVSNGVRAARVAGAPGARVLPAPSPAELSNSFARIADEVEPAVVNINTESTVRIGRRYRVPEDSPFGDFFDRFFQFGPEGPGGEMPQRNLGSGVVLDKTGYIMTNYHVIMNLAASEDKPVDRIRVRLHGEEDNPKGYEAKIIGTDKATDLAVIKIDVNRPLPAAEFGDSDAVRVGDWVLAVGSPFGLDSTVTAGIISAKGRDIEGGPEGQFKRFIQTDAAINPGNSGGPLVNMGGQIIGINTAIATRAGSYDGVGFAIPSNMARKVYNAIITTGSVQRGAIGVSFLSQPNAALLRSFGADNGVVVNSVTPGSPADRAGLQRGDVIIAVDGMPIHRGDELVAIVSDAEVGKKLRLEYLRNKKRTSVDVEVGDRNKIVRDSIGGVEEGEGEEGETKTRGALGISVRNLTVEQARDLAEELHLSGPQGVLVSSVQPRSFAADLGVQRGDIILSINHQTAESVADFNRLESQLKSGQDVLLLVARRTQRTFTTLYLADRLP